MLAKPIDAGARTLGATLRKEIAIMSITATFNSVTGLLFVTGDNLGTPIVIGRDTEGQIFHQ